MAKKEQRNLFSKLTKLFRSGPVVKRKIRALDTTSVKPDTSKSSGTLLFQKSLSPTYATITSNAYNLSERLMRYQDFCFGGDVIVYTLDGAMTFKELVERYPNGERFFVYSYDYELKQPVIGTAFCPRLAREGKKSSLLRVKFDDGGYVDVTPDHKMVLRDGSTREAKDLKVNDSLMPLNVNDITDTRYSFERDEVTFSSIVDACSAFNGDISSIMSRLYVSRSRVEQLLRDKGFNGLSDVMSRLNEAHRLATHLSIERETRRPTLLEIQYFASVCQSIDEAAARLRCSRHAVNTCLSLAGHKDWDQYRSNFYHQDIGKIHVTGDRNITDIEVLDDDFVYTVTVEKHHNLAVGIANNYVFATQSEMEYCLDSTTCIPTVDGMVELGELARRCDADPDYQFIVYSYDHEKQEIVPAFGKQARQTRVDHAWKVTFDSGKTITGSGNHRLMMRDGTYREIRDLQPGDSMMPFYRKDFYADSVKGTPGYSWIYNMNKWVAEHRLIAEWVEGRQLTDDEVVHHVNFVKSDNRPENLQVMTRSAHSSYHAGINNDHKWDTGNSDWIEKFKRNHAVWMRDNAPTSRKDVTFGKILEVSECLGFDLAKVSKALDVDKNVIYSRLADNGFSTYESFTTAYKFGNIAVDGKRSLCVSDLDLETVIATMEQHDSKQQVCIKLGCTVNVLNKFLDRKAGVSWTDLRKQKGWSDEGHRGGRPKGMNGNALTFQQVCDAYVSGMSLPMLAEKLSVNKNTIVSRIAQHGFKKYSEFQSSYENHKVVSVEYVGVIPLFDFTVDGYKNFATDSVISHNTPEIAGALDIYADETVAQDDMGKVLHVYSDNEKIKETLEELFYDTLNVEFNARSWVRNLPLHKDTLIPLLDGRNITIEQLSNEFVAGKENWVYSVQDGTHRTVPGKVTWCGLTRKDSELVRVTLDDNTYVDCTPDHEFIMRDGSSKRADQLTPGLSMMPFYRRVSDVSRGDKLNGYERVYDPRTDAYVYTHSRVAEILPEGKLNGGRWLVTHHIDFDKRNNDPKNLVRIDDQQHIKMHGEHGIKVLQRPDVIVKRMIGIDSWLRSNKHRDIARQQLIKLQDRGLMRKSWDDYNRSEQFVIDHGKRSAASIQMWNVRRDELRRSMSIKVDARCLDMMIEKLRESSTYQTTVEFGRSLIESDEFVSHFYDVNKGTRRDLRKSLRSHAGITTLLNRLGIDSYPDFVKQFAPELHAQSCLKTGRNFHKSSSRPLNHKVLKVERLQSTSDVYCMTVVGPNDEHDRHNFAVITAGGSVDNGTFVSNCKYGDAFLYIDVDPKYGVVNAFPIPVNEIEREENFDREDPFAVRFRWVTMGNRTLENWEIAHFRLLGNDMFIPYGSSIIEPARRIWRQLILIEDAMLVYRVCRAPERRVFYIDVANVPAENVPMYIEEQKKNLRSSQVIDGSTGRVDLRYNPMPVHKDTPVPLLDGRMLTIEQLSREHEQGSDVWVYSVQDGTHKIVPGKVSWCGKNYTTKKIVKVTLDDGTHVKTAPEHPFIMRDGTTKRADELTTGDSLMPLYARLSTKQHGFDIEGYQTIYDPHSESYKLVHRLVANDVLAQQREETRVVTDWTVNNNLTVHHCDVNRLNNSPTNLRWMGNVDHIRWHASVGRENLIKWNKSEKKKQRVSQLNKERNSVAAMIGYNGSVLHASHNEARRQAQLASWNEKKQERSQAMRWVVPEEFFVIGKEKLLNDPTLNRDRFHSAMMADVRVIELLKNSQTSKRDVSKFSYCTWIQQLRTNGCDGFDEFKRSTLGSVYKRRKNHSVINVEIIDENVDVYCMTVIGANGEDDRHNFAVLGLSDQLSDKVSVSNGNYSLSGIFVKNSVEEDYFMPVRGAETGTKIDTLKGGENTAAVEDVAYIQKKLFAALKIPRAYLGYDDALASKATLAQEDIRFSRTINVIQKTLIAELNKIAIIHLYAHGFDGEDLQNFTLRLSNPSSIAQQQKLELWRAKFEIGGSMPEGMGSATMVQRDIWGLTPERIMQLRRERMEERMFDAQIEAAVTNIGAGGEGGGGDDLLGDLGGGGGGGAPPKPPAGGGGGEKPPAGGEKKTPPPETAGEIPDEEEEPELELLTSADDAQDGEERSLKRQGREAPLKAVDRIKHYQYNRSRIDHGSAGRTHMPNFAKMTGNDNDAMKDPSDSGWMKSLVSNPFSESAARSRTVPTKSMLSMLVRMRGVVRPQVSDDSLLTEGIDVIDDMAAEGVDAGIDVSDDD